jgi:hypothetical protein
MAMLTIENDGDLKLESGSTLILSDGNTLTVNDGGKLTLMGEDGNPVTVTSAGYFVFIVSSGGTIGAEYATFEKMSGDGLNVQSGATIDPALPLQQQHFPERSFRQHIPYHQQQPGTHH